MEVNDFIDLNTTELFDDSNESFDKLEENDNSGRNISEDDNFGTTTSTDMADTREEFSSSDAGKTSTDVVPSATIEEVRLLNSLSVPTAVITPTIPSGLSIIQKCAKSQLTSDNSSMRKPSVIVADNVPTQLNIRPTSVISKAGGVHETSKNNLEMSGSGGSPSVRPQLSQKYQPAINKGHISAPGNAITTSTKLVKIAPSTTTAISDIKTSPVIIVQTPAQKLGQKFTSLKILPTTAGSIVKQKILNLNEVRKLNSGGSLKLLNAPSSTISSTDTSLTYLQSPPSLIVLKPPITSTSSPVTHSSTLQLKPQQLYQTMPATNPTKPATISFVTAPNKPPTSIAIGTKILQNKILTTVKPNASDPSTQQLPPGLTKIPKETVVNKIAKEAHGIDVLRMIATKKPEKTVEPTVTIGQKPMSNKPASDFQPLTNFLSSSDKPKILCGANTATTKSEQTTSLETSNGKLLDDTATGRISVESITISNGKLSNPNGSIKILKSVDDSDVANAEQFSDTERCSDKKLEKLNTSPRLQGRSKSLNIAKQQTKLRRRYPSAGNNITSTSCERNFSENICTGEVSILRLDREKKVVKPDPIEEEETTENKSIEDVAEDEQIKLAGDSLECDEKIDDSDKSKSVSPDVALIGNNRQIPATSIATTSTATIATPTTIGASSSNVDKKIDDPLTYIKWRNGVGFLRFSNLQFSKNEFNLLEVVELKESAKRPKLALKANDLSDQITIDLIDRKSDASDGGKSGAIGKKKIETKQRFKRAGMNLLQNVFVWELYLRLMDAQAAPDSLFINPFPSSPNLFEVGMKMEAIDPEHSSLFCVCTVVEKLGYRIRLTFDGYNDKFSFWRNADSMDIFPPGWCAKTGRQLQPPLKYGNESFDWHRYILKTNGKFAPRSNFTHLNSMTTRNPFKVGMKLEADNLKLGRDKVSIATIADVLDSRILLQFEGFDSTHDYWADITSPNIHPVNWHKANGCRIVESKNHGGTFSWPHYIAVTHTQPVPKEYFCPRPPIGFQEGMKLEIVDKKVPTLIRPCTVIQVADYRIQVLFDGWPATYSYWIDDDHPDIHPINWCLKTEHPLEPPLNFGQEEFRSACGVLGCREVGNAKHFGVGFHYTIFECPYESRNWLSVDTKPDRLVEVTAQKVRKRKTRPIMSATESYQKIKLELPSSEQSVSLLSTPSNEWNALPAKIKKEEIEIGETKLLQPIIPAMPTDVSPIRVPRHIQVTEPILHDYGPSLMHVHKLWKQNSKSVNIRRIAKNPLCWTIDEVADYVSRLPNCSKLGKLMRDHEIDGDSFLKLCQNDLVDVLEIRLGPAVKIYNQIVALRSEVCEKYMESE